MPDEITFDMMRERLYSAAVSDALDSLGYWKLFFWDFSFFLFPSGGCCVSEAAKEVDAVETAIALSSPTAAARAADGPPRFRT